jgi:protein-tyrosine phosphatase
MFFRSEALNRLSHGDYARIRELGIDSICDLRYLEERRRDVTRVPEHLPIEVLELGLDERPHPRFQDSLQPVAGNEEEAAEHLMENYRHYPHLYQDAYIGILHRLARDDGGGVVVHCTAGKDRAGFATAMVLTALGVERDVIIDDYLLTNQFWDRAGREPSGWPQSVLDAIFGAHRHYIEAAFGVIDEHYGGTDRYIEKTLGFDESNRADLCARLLQA